MKKPPMNFSPTSTAEAAEYMKLQAAAHTRASRRTMKPLKIAEVREHTGRRMTVAEASIFVSPHQPRQIIRNQACALSMHTWNNTKTDWLRLEACLVLLHARRAR